MTLDYRGAGVRDQAGALRAVAHRLGGTLAHAEGARVLTGFEHYASVLQLSDDVALALCTDGVGTKTIVAAALDRYDTIGFDCVAMNVNDLLCVGARPLALVDYLAVNSLDEGRADAILRGLAEAAAVAGIAIPGGETAQLPEIVGSGGDERAFDLVGTCVGTLHPAHFVDGRAIRPGDELVGIASTGIHSNGLTLARRALLGQAGLVLDDRVPELGRTVGEELLEPTAIYAPAIRALWDEGIETPGLAHITGDGLLNLSRLGAGAVGFVVERLPERPPIFTLVQDAGGVPDEEMFRVFNMGVGFVVVVRAGDADRAARVIESRGHSATRLGRATAEPGRVVIEPAGLAGTRAAGAGRLEAV
jgi:phosphoribosylformylglycinamidine cyclo-ligase